MTPTKTRDTLLQAKDLVSDDSANRLKSPVNGSMAFNAQGDEVAIRVIALLAAVLDVMDFESGQGTTVLASPAISRQNPPVEGLI